VIVALTAHAMEGDRENCLATGMDDYLGKPFTVEQLRCTLERWLPKELAQKAHSTVRADGGRVTMAVSADKGTPAPDGALLSAPPESPGDGGRLHSFTPEVPAEGNSDAAHVDHKAFENIRSLQRSGAPDMLSKVIGIYLRDTPKLLENTRNALALKDAKAMGGQAHSMKSSSATLGAHALAALCKELEAMGRSGTTENAEGLLSRIELEYASVAKILARELRSG